VKTARRGALSTWMKTEQGSNTVKTKQGSRELLLLEL
jgi:hypothetical protein